MLRVPKIRGGHQHGVQVRLLVEHLLIIDVGRALVAVSLVGVERAGYAALVAFFPNIANRAELDAGVATQLKDRIHQHLSLGARTQQGDIDVFFLILRLTKRLACHHQARTDCCR